MGNRYWMWLAARLLVAIAIVGWAASYIGAGSGEKEFQKTLDAMKQVHSFRMATTSSAGTQRDDMLFEVDCDHNILHHEVHAVDTHTTPGETTLEELNVAGQGYQRQTDGTWTAAKGGFALIPAKRYCGHLAEGTDSGVLPAIATMIRRGIIQKGDKKIVNGVRCREWLVTMKGSPRGLEHDTVCLGLDDHLPYEVTVDWEAARTTFSDYNTPIQFDLPEAAVRPTSATGPAN
jgi:hypothetical protein